MQKEISMLKRAVSTSRLNNASLTGTSIPVYDVDGETQMLSIGLQKDGTAELV